MKTRMQRLKQGHDGIFRVVLGRGCDGNSVLYVQSWYSDRNRYAIFPAAWRGFCGSDLRTEMQAIVTPSQLPLQPTL